MESINRLIYLVLFIGVLFSSCTNREDIYGVYINNIKSSNNIDTIKIYRDGTYDRLIYDKLNKSLIFKNKNFWKYENSKVILKKILENYGGYSFKNKRESYDKYLMTYFFSTEKGNDGLRLRYDKRNGYYFLKVCKDTDPSFCANER